MGGLARYQHQLKPNLRGEFPRHFLFFDTETTQTRVDKNEIDFPVLMNHLPDWIDIIDKYAEKEKNINSNEMQQRILTEYVLCEISYLKKYKKQRLNFYSQEVQSTIRAINVNSNFLELGPKKINPIIKNIFPEYQNKN